MPNTEILRIGNSKKEYSSLTKIDFDISVADGYKDVGYTNIHIDDCWMEYNRSADGKLVADRQRFSSGIPALSNFVRLQFSKILSHKKN